MTGFQVLDRLKADDQTQDIPVIINTSKILDEAEQRLFDGRVISVLDKSIWSREDAMDLLRNTLRKAGLDASGLGGREP